MVELYCVVTTSVYLYSKGKMTVGDYSPVDTSHCSEPLMMETDGNQSSILTLFRSWGPSCWCWRRHSRCTWRRSWCPPWRTGGQGAASPGAACWRSWPGRRDWTSLSSRSQRFSLTNIIVWSLLSSPPRTLHPSLASSLFLTEIQSKSEKCWVIDWRLPSDLSVSLLCLFTQGWVWRLTWMARLHNIHWLLIVDLLRITENWTHPEVSSSALNLVDMT